MKIEYNVLHRPVFNQIGSLNEQIFAATLQANHELSHIAERNWTSDDVDILSLKGDFELISSSNDGVQLKAVYKYKDEGLLYIKDYLAELEAISASTSIEQAGELLNIFMKAFPKKERSDGEVKVVFWSDGQHGATSVSRRITVPGWDTILQNYPQQSRDEINKLMEMEVWNPEHGQLMLWHGAPGTGKTYSLRALAKQWKSWADIHYITDPDKFFNNGEYMLRVLLGGGSDVNEEYLPRDEQLRREQMWHLLVLEDCGEMISADAKERVGQGLARLLNIVDGLIGQGLKVVLLITTNEPVGKLHEAVRRPGRCSALVEFVDFSKDEANEWLDAHESAKEVDGATSLANLYAVKDGYTEVEPVKMGFA